ncbi:MAG: energy transducer TonB [Porticoccaceae bacterium]|nr:energy transducer TonB [Porticoccaceae bacterium]
MENLIESPWNTTDERLRKTFSAALIFHFVLLIGVSFTLPSGSSPATSMEVTLAHYKTDQAPEEADFVAQANQLGSGDQAQAIQPTTDQLSPFEGRDQGQMPVPQQQPLQADSQTILASAGDRANPQINRQENNDPADNRSTPQAQMEDRDIGAIRAELDRLQRAYSKLPRVLRMTSASAKSADEAAYMHYFEKRVEQVGNVNYPQEARTRRIFGHVQLVVALLANGRIKHIEVSKTSGSRLLDQAAVRSVRLASPYEPFPAELRDRDEIHIIRTWQYQSNNVLTTN